MSWVLCFVLAAVLGSVTSYDILRDYSGTTFFDRWDYYGNEDNLTFGNANYLDRDTASQQSLTYTDANGRAVIKVDNSSLVSPGQNRNSIRITTQDFYEVRFLQSRMREQSLTASF